MTGFGMDRRRAVSPQLRRRIRIAGIVLGSAAGLAIAVVVGGVVSSALAARSNLEAVFPMVATLQSSVVRGDTETAHDVAESIAERTAAAADAVHNPLWDAAEGFPVAGPNLAAIRIAAEVSDSIARDAVLPAAGIRLDAFQPVSGRIDIAAIRDTQPLVDAALAAVTDARERLAGIDALALAGPIASPVLQLEAQLGDIQPVLESLSTAARLMPNALGAEGARNYLLMFSNNAELRTQGGNPAALALVTIDAGSISIREQMPGTYVPAVGGSLVPVTGEERALFGDSLGTVMSSTTSVPDFAVTAAMAKSLWEARFDTDIHAVVMIDPRALSYILEAIGPVAISADESITSENVVDMLLRDSYSRYETADGQDAFFTGVTASVFVAVASGQGSFPALIDRLVSAADEGRIRMWSADPSEQEIFEEGPIGGAFGADSPVESRIGVFLNDRTGVKLGYYLDATIVAEADRCNAEDSPVTVTVDLTSTLPIDAVLPQSLVSAEYPGGQLRVDIALYGPEGTTVREVTVNDEPVDAAFNGSDHGRPVVMVPVTIPAAGEMTVEVSFEAGEVDLGAVTVVRTPMVRSVPVEILDVHC